MRPGGIERPPSSLPSPPRGALENKFCGGFGHFGHTTRECGGGTRCVPVNRRDRAHMTLISFHRFRITSRVCSTRLLGRSRVGGARRGDYPVYNCAPPPPVTVRSRRPEGIAPHASSSGRIWDDRWMIDPFWAKKDSEYS